MYRGKDGSEMTVPIDMGANTVVDYDAQHVLVALRNELHRITGPCGLGSVSDIVEASSLFA